MEFQLGRRSQKPWALPNARNNYTTLFIKSQEKFFTEKVK
jgi:hypothetical protein